MEHLHKLVVLGTIPKTDTKHFNRVYALVRINFTKPPQNTTKIPKEASKWMKEVMRDSKWRS